MGMEAGVGKNADKRVMPGTECPTTSYKCPGKVRCLLISLYPHRFLFYPTPKHPAQIGFLRDETGLVVAAVDAAGQVVWQGSYDPYGRLLASTTASTAPTEVPMRFAGQWFDRDAGLVYNHNRWYDSRVGRYLRPDPLFEQGQWQDPYMYVQGNPYTFSDPLGLSKWRDAALDLIDAHGGSIDGAMDDIADTRNNCGGTNLDNALIDHYLFARGLMNDHSPGLVGHEVLRGAGMAAAMLWEGGKVGAMYVEGDEYFTNTDTSRPSFEGLLVVAEAIQDSEDYFTRKGEYWRIPLGKWAGLMWDYYF